MAPDSPPEVASGHGGAPRVYHHGFSVRLCLTASPERTAAGLAALGLPPPEGSRQRTWIDTSTGAGRRRWTMRGSAWLSGRSPRNKKLPLRSFNIAHGLHLYVLAVEQAVDGTAYLDLSGVRERDVSEVVECVMGLNADEHQVAYWRQVERYVVLSPPDAHALAAALGSSPSRGRGRLARKEYLVRDWPVAVTLGVRRRATATLSVYRIRGGATAAYRMEVSVRGNRANRSHLRESDGDVLEAALLAFVAEHGLSPLPKPNRWEPRDPADDAVVYDPEHGRIHAGYYRGKKPRIQALPDCHTPLPVRIWQAPVRDEEVGEVEGVPGVSAPSLSSGEGEDDDSISTLTQVPTSPTSLLTHDDDEGESTTYLSLPTGGTSKCPSSVCGVLTQELLSLPSGFVAEVILDGDAPPHRLVSDLLGASNSPVSVAYLGPEDAIPLPLAELMTSRHTTRLEAHDMVLVVDPLVPKSVVSLLVEEWRQVLETGGGRLVLVTCDARSTWRPLARDHRSTGGQGARYFTHQRYRACAGRKGGWVVLKDEAEGRAGRVIR